MNIFYLDRNAQTAAEMLTDKHVVKMVLESAQILSTVVSKQGLKTEYKPTHQNHPCVVWAGQSFDNFMWLYAHGLYIGSEFTKRYGNWHKSSQVIANLPILTHWPLDVFTEPPMCMPDVYKIGNDVISSYRAYYLAEKVKANSYKKLPERGNWCNFAVTSMC